MLCQAVAVGPPCCCESDKTVLSSALHGVFPGNKLSELSWKRVVLSQVERTRWPGAHPQRCGHCIKGGTTSALPLNFHQ